MTPDDPFTITVRRRLPLLAAFVSGALVLPATLLALASPMAMDGGESLGGWLLVLFLTAQPVLLLGAAIAGVLCYRRFSRLRLAGALVPPTLALLAAGLLSAP